MPADVRPAPRPDTPAAERELRPLPGREAAVTSVGAPAPVAAKLMEEAPVPVAVEATAARAAQAAVVVTEAVEVTAAAIITPVDALVPSPPG